MAHTDKTTKPPPPSPKLPPEAGKCAGGDLIILHRQAILTTYTRAAHVHQQCHALTECQLIPGASSIITPAFIHQSCTETSADLRVLNDVRSDPRPLHKKKKKKLSDNNQNSENVCAQTMNRLHGIEPPGHSFKLIKTI